MTLQQRANSGYRGAIILNIILIIIAGVLLAITLCGCAPFRFPAVPGPSNPPPATASHFFGLIGGQPATATATADGARQPVASAVASIVHYCEIAGALCLVAAGLLGYFGQIIPAVKVGLAGIAIIVFGKWFDYHYGLVIAGMLICAAAGFLWAWYKDDPSEVRTLTAKVEAFFASAGKTVAADAATLKLPKV